MKSLVIGIVLGAIIGLAVSFTFLYSLWLPITTVTILLSALFGKVAWKTSAAPSLIGAACTLIIYFGVFWLPPEMASRRASTPAEHALAARELAGRAQSFGDVDRAFAHLVIAAEGDQVPSLLAVGEAYLYGHYHVKRDPSKARRWLERAAELGSKEASRELSNDYHYPEPKS
jgi:hypothetical protein